MHYNETRFGFEWGAARVSRAMCDARQGWVVIDLETPRQILQIFVSRAGRVRISDSRGEWVPPAGTTGGG